MDKNDTFHATQINRNTKLYMVRVSDAECVPYVTQRPNCNGQEIVSAHDMSFMESSFDMFVANHMQL